MIRDLRAAMLMSALAGCVLSGCSDDEGESPSSESSSGVNASGAAIDVVASFYPLEWMAQQVGGEHVEVSGLTPPGAEPHDLELSPTDIAGVADADVVAFLSGFQPAVDEALDGSGADVFDAAEATALSRTFTPIEEGTEDTAEAGAVDPHFWLDPLRLAEVADAFALLLAEVDPPNAETYVARADRLRTELESLDSEFIAGLTDCAHTNLVTSHNAFGYLADRYGLEQVGITGLTPEQEPTPSDIAAVADYVEANGVTTIYFETLVSSAIAETIAAETGAVTVVLDPIEGLSDQSEGSDYFEVMRSNLANLRTGQSCS